MTTKESKETKKAVKRAPKKAAKKEAAPVVERNGTTSLKVLSIEGKEVGTIELNKEVFGIEPNETLVHDTVRWQLARRRAGTHSALTRSMIQGGKKKPFKQKHTGRSRQGSSVSPLMVGGAVVHGPLPRCYDYRLPKRTRRQALASVLSDKVLGSKLIVIDELKLKEIKTQAMAKVLDKVGVSGQNATVIVVKLDEQVARSARNLPKVVTLPASAANVYDILKHDFVVVTQEGIKALEERVLKD